MATFEPIGYLKSTHTYKYQQPRQSVFARNRGEIILNSGNNFEQALEDLAEFDKIWLIYEFNQNSNWKPKVTPPITKDGKKKGVFSTRSPHRPNPIGISCVDLAEVKGRVLVVENFDLLDNTPILDIKPYIAQYDSFPQASRGWLIEEGAHEYSLSFTENVEKQLLWIYKKCNLDIKDTLVAQLSSDPINRKRKRVKHLSDNYYELSIRTWRVRFNIEEKNVSVDCIYSGYSKDELNDPNDKYCDKDFHRDFGNLFK